MITSYKCECCGYIYRSNDLIIKCEKCYEDLCVNCSSHEEFNKKLCRECNNQDVDINSKEE